MVFSKPTRCTRENIAYDEGVWPLCHREFSGAHMNLIDGRCKIDIPPQVACWRGFNWPLCGVYKPDHFWWCKFSHVRKGIELNWEINVPCFFQWRNKLRSAFKSMSPITINYHLALETETALTAIIALFEGLAGNCWKSLIIRRVLPYRKACVLFFCMTNQAFPFASYANFQLIVCWCVLKALAFARHGKTVRFPWNTSRWVYY